MTDSARSPMILSFLSTPSARRATDHMDDETEASKISIHALREEGDLVRLCRKAPVPNFYPRPPRGGRQSNTAEDIAEMEFLSTPSARRATEGL